jgi:NitT/TauT family transport system permease protein
LLPALAPEASPASPAAPSSPQLQASDFRRSSIGAFLAITDRGPRTTGHSPEATDHRPRATPSGIARNLFSGILSGSYLRALAASALRIAAGFSLAALLGAALGLLQAATPRLRHLFGPLTTGVQALPAVCWLPVALLWFGPGEAAILFVVVLGSVFAIALGVRDGLAQVPPLYRRVGQTFGMSRWQHATRITLPAALPAILAGLKQGWSFGWRALMAGELVYASSGLGRSLVAGRDSGDANGVFAVMLLILALGIAVDRLVFGVVERRVLERRGLASH